MSEPDAFWSLKLPDIINAAILTATVVAIWFGPLKAVDIARNKDIEKEAENRKRQIFAALMRTRKTTMTPDHVGALNQLQLEFFNHPTVIAAYKSYIANLSEAAPLPGNDLQNFLTRRNDLFFDLLLEIGKAIGVNLDRHELDRLAYVPVGWHTDEQEAKIFRASLIEVLQGRKPIQVVPGQPQLPNSPQSPFPPPP